MSGRRLAPIGFSALALAIVAVPRTVDADPRPFAFTYDTYPVGKGQGEVEQWVTWNTRKEGERGYDSIQFREEIEFGLADNIDLHVYIPTWTYEDSSARSGTRFDRVDAALLVYLSNPVTDPIGVGIYSEIGAGEAGLLFEQKLLLQKDIGKWVFAYNLVAETEVEGVFAKGGEKEIEGEIENVLGISYGGVRGWYFGAEVIAESAFESWSHYEGTTVYAGPAISFQGSERFWVTVTPTYQLTDREDAGDFQVRMIAGIEF